MAKCFCGCGQRVAFSRRPMNTSGRRVAEALETLPAIHDTTELRTLMDEDFDAFMKQGEEYRSGLAVVVHGERHPAEFDEAGMRDWLRRAWTIEADVKQIKFAITQGESFDDARVATFLGRWVRESGLSEEAAFALIKERAQAGQPMPWQD